MVRARFLPLIALLLGAACSSGSSTAPDDAGVTADAGPPTAVFTTPAKVSDLDGDHWFDHPWPSDFRREGQAVRLDGWPNPRASTLIGSYLDQTRGKIDGFSPVAAGYLTFTSAVDTTTLPATEKASLATTSSLQLVDVDDKSPEKGSRHPVKWVFRDKVGDYYLVPDVLSWAPALGHPLRPKTKYAIVATRDLKGVDGKPAAPNDVLTGVLAGQGALGNAWAPAIAALGAAGIAKDRIAHLSVFTTSDPVGEALKVADAVRALPPPKVTSLAQDGQTADYDRYTGNYSGSPDYQQGTPPFLTEGGAFQFDASGNPVKQRDFDLRFKLVVPKASKCPMPAGGYPIVLYAHGTGGDWTSFIDDGTATVLAQKCLASMGVDQIFHGTRPGAPPPTDPDRESKISLAFFNLSNADAARTNTRQSAMDEVARAHLITSGGLSVAVNDAAGKPLSYTGAAVTFDTKKIGFFGHSQGGLNGALLLAIDDQTRGGVLSGAGSTISYSLLMKELPSPSVAGLVKVFLGVSADNADELTPLHPAMTLVQTIIDPADPVHYYPGMARSPFAGHSPKSVFMTEGINADGTGDNYAPPRTIESGAIAGGFPLLSPVVYDVPEITQLDGVAPATPPVKGNAAGGKTTVGLAQFPPKAGSDGHFVVFDIPRARSMAANFSASVLNDDVPTLGP